MDISIRELNSNDYEQFFKLINDFRETKFTQEEFLKHLKTISGYSKIYVIEKNSELIATGTLIIEQKFIYNCSKLAHIEDVCVKKELRSQGFGKIIVKKLIEEATKEKCYKITLVCSESNTKFYATTGFEVRGFQMSQLLN
jgi:glucosamine-phosphate N-acetyltransferase